jgi:glycosyltransferase involved in cell wall biosynthesis
MGGAPRFIVDLSNWASSFAEIHILCKGYDGFWSNKVNAEIHDVVDDLNGEILIRKLSPSLIHHHYPLYGWLMNSVKDFPHVGTCHGYLDTLHIPIKDSNWIIPISGNSVNKILHGIDISKFTCKVHVKKKNLVVGIIARRSEEKIPISFIRYLRSNKIPKNITLRVIGNGNSRTSELITKQLVEVEDLQLIGDLSQNQIVEQYPQLDVLLIPSMKDSCSYVALEAMAAGIPIVYREVEALPDIIQYAGLGGNTDEELFIQINKLSKSVELRNSMGQSGRRLIEQRHNIDRMFDDYNKIYSQLTKQIVRQPQTDIDCSVVIPVRNTESKYLIPSIKSVLNQKNINFETIIIDDDSTNEDTLTALDLFSGKVKIVHRKHTEIEGCGPALNLGIKEAKSNLIIRHDSDDIMLPDRLQMQVQYHKDHPDVSLSAGQMYVINGENQRVGTLDFKQFDENKPYWLQDWDHNGIAHPTVAFNRHLILTLGGYVEGICQDLDLWSRMWLANAKMVILPWYFTEYRQIKEHEDRISRRNEIINKYNETLLYIKNQCQSLKPFLERFG